MRPPDQPRHEQRLETLLRNEFALVELRVEDAGNGPALRIRDTVTDRSILLDALELEALTRLSHSDVGRLVASDATDGGNAAVDEKTGLTVDAQRANGYTVSGS